MLLNELELYEGRRVIDSMEIMDALLKSEIRDFSNCMLIRLDFSHLCFRMFKFEHCMFNDCRFTFVDCVNASFTDSCFYGCTMRMCDFRQADMSSCTFVSASINNSEFISCNFAESLFRNSRICCVQISDANFDHVVWDGGNMSGLQIDRPIRNLDTLKIMYAGTTVEELKTLASSVRREMDKEARNKEQYMVFIKPEYVRDANAFLWHKLPGTGEQETDIHKAEYSEYWSDINGPVLVMTTDEPVWTRIHTLYPEADDSVFMIVPTTFGSQKVLAGGV